MATPARSILRPRDFRFSILAMLMLVTVQTAHAQTRVRRLGERIREGVQARLPLGPIAPAPVAPGPVAPPGVNRAGVNRANAMPTPAMQPRVAVPLANRAPVARSNYNGATGRNAQASAIDDTGVSVLSAAKPPFASRARLGVTVETPASPTNGRNQRPARGALVVGVGERSGAEAAGLQIGDLIVAIDGRMVDNVESFVARLVNKVPGDSVDLRYVRDQKLYAASAIMAGPDGRLEDSQYAEQLALLDPHASPTPPNNANANAGGDGSSLGGLGRIVGGWLGGNNDKAENQTVAPKSDEPEIEVTESEELPPPASAEDFQPLIVEEANAEAAAERMKSDYDALESPADTEVTEEESLPPPVQ